MLKTKLNKFLGWSFVSNLSVSIENTLAMDGIFNCFTNNINANVNTTFTTNYICKETIGQTIGMAYFLYKKRKSVDIDAKKLFKQVNAFQQSSILIETMLPLLSQKYHLPIAILSNTATNISFIGFGSINVKMISNLDSKNIGELYVKLSIINTLASTLGSGIGLVILSKLHSPEHRALCIPIFAIIRYISFKKMLEISE